MSSNFEWLLMEYGSAGDAEELFTLARELEKQGKFRIAATAYDRAFGLEPDNKKIVMARKQLLERLAVVEHGIKFCYIPAGSFLMGFDKGDPDEQPVHPVQLDGYWMSEIPISWTAHIGIMGEPEWEDRGNTIRARYCATDMTNPLVEDWTQYDEKPMVSVSWSVVELLCGVISTNMILYRLPTEAEWEKAARGGLINCKYPWGDEIPNENTCDFNSFERFSILPSRSLPPNNYGLYGMSGGVWEWTQDWY
ncbi:MAG: SUMF1/EgtB/PvdO family nonheme iron enzyme, partial [Promethearchaeota archaeon]